MNEIRIFDNEEFGKVRTLMIDEEPWFVGKDVAIALGYKKVTEALKNGVDEMDSTFMGVIDSLGREQLTKIINESGLYSLIFGSKLKSAKKFKRWVTSEILPQLRKTGSYGAPKLPKTPMELLELHYEAIKQVDEKVGKVDEKVDTLEDRFNRFEADIPVFTIDTKNIQSAVRKKGIEVLGGKESNAYRDKSTRTYVYSDIQCMLRRNFGVRRYEEIRHRQADIALKLIEDYTPPLFLQNRVNAENSQISFNFS